MGAKQTVIIVAIIVTILTVGYYCVYKMSERRNGNSNEKVLQELAPLGLNNDIIAVVKAEGCKNIHRTGDIWTISNCKEDLNVRVLAQDEGYVMEICGGWSDGKAAVNGAKIALKALGIEVDCDINSIYLKSKSGSIEVYDVCGKIFGMRGGCIV